MTSIIEDQMRLSREAAARDAASVREEFLAERYGVGYPDAQPANPKQVYGDQNVPLHLFPASAIAGGAMALLEGNLKYGRNNFRAVHVEAMTYARACDSHMKKWQEGTDIDPDSGLDELFKAIACIAILIDAKYAGTLIDNRNHNGAHVAKMLADLRVDVERLRKQHADKSPRHYTIADNGKA